MFGLVCVISLSLSTWYIIEKRGSLETIKPLGTLFQLLVYLQEFWCLRRLVLDIFKISLKMVVHIKMALQNT